MTDLFDHQLAIDTAIATDIAGLIGTTDPIDRKAINAIMTGHHGGSDATGKWTQRDSFDLTELALAIHLQNTNHSLGPSRVMSAATLMKRLPTQTVRSEEQIAFQQFSTPADLAALACWLAAPQADDVVLEPSAGHGLLVAQLPAVAALHLNELDEARRTRLPAAFPTAAITAHDGAVIHARSEIRPSLILMNPPFSRSFGRGEDDLAAVRHVKSALTTLRPGGRLVAVMPDWFSNSARLRDIWADLFAHSSILTSLRFRDAYRKHGTGIAVRLYVIDKVAGLDGAATIDRAHVEEVVDLVTPLARAQARDLTSTAPASGQGRGVGLFRAVRSIKAARPKAQFAPQRNEVRRVAYTSLAEPAPQLPAVGVYLPYRPSRIIFERAGEHPTPLVESIAMGSIAAPPATYVPNLPERTVDDRLLSAAQLETVVYAGTAWEQWLPGKFKPASEGVGLEIADDGQSYRKGFFLGDGTGAGKGRQIAAVVLDSWLAGRRRGIWVSKNEPLIDDARRDWTAIGGLGTDIQSLTQWKIDEPITLDQGVLFVTYPTLRSQRGEHSRLQQILRWAGADFDGVIAFDEAHEMGGVAGGEGALGRKNGSQQGTCGVLLQNNLPAARVLYASATGASEVNNLAYAVRLGLWGPYTAFANREEFITSIRDGGIAAMELVARDLKATGLYMARALSFAGVEYEVLRHDLTDEQIAVYDEYARAWAILCAAAHKMLYREEAIMRRNAA